MRKSKLIIFLLLILILCGCQKEKIDHSEQDMIIKMNEKVSDNFYIDLDIDYSDVKVGKIIQTGVNLYSINDNEILRMKELFGTESFLGYKEEVSEDGYFTQSSENIYEYLSLTNIARIKWSNRAETLNYQYTSGRNTSFFRADMDTLFTKKNLAFLSNEEAKEISNYFIDELGFVTDKSQMKYYCLDSETLNQIFSKYAEDDIKSMLSMGLPFQKEWKEDEGIYLFFYPQIIDDITISDNGMYSFDNNYAYTLVGKEGLLGIKCGANYKKMGEKETNIITAKQAFESISKIYKNTILTDICTIDSLKLKYMVIDSDYDKKEATLSMVWEFGVSITDELTGELKNKEYIVYDAVKGNRLMGQ